MDSVEFAEMEPLVDSCANYLRHTTPSDDPIGRTEAERFLQRWAAYVPYLVIEQQPYLFELTEKNETFILQHLAGKVQYLLSHRGVPSNSYSSELQGLHWMIQLYQSGEYPRIDRLELRLQRAANESNEEWLRKQLPRDWNDL